MMKRKIIFTLFSLTALILCGCQKGDNIGSSLVNSSDSPISSSPSDSDIDVKEVDKDSIQVMSANLDQGHQNDEYYHKFVLTEILSVMPDLLGVQEESDGWVNYLKPTLEEYGYQHIYESRGGAFSEASGIFIKVDRFNIVESGTFWFGDNESASSGYVASEWGSMFPRVCSWALLEDTYTNKDLCYFNAHLEYNHAFGSYDDPTETSNTKLCREKSCRQVIRKMSALDVPGIFTGDLNYWREEEPDTYQACLSYFDDAWANYEGHQNMCTFHDYGTELNETTRKHPYSPIDYIFSTKNCFKVNKFTIMNKEGNQESDFASDHFFVHANLTYLEKEDKGLKDGSFLVMSANLDQGHQNDSYYHNKVKKQFYKVMPDLLGVQEEGNGWINALTNDMKEKGYTHITKTRGGSFPEASGIFIKDSRFEIKDSGTFWFCADEANENVEGYIATEWGATFPRICTWALLHDKVNDIDVSFFNAHLEYNHAFGSMNGAASPENNTIACRMNSCRQVIRKMRALGVPGFFTGDLNSFRENEPAVYNTCLTYFDDSWAKYPSSAQMCTFHDYGRELNPSIRQNPYSPIDYIYSTKDQFDVSNFTIMSNSGTQESDFDSDHFFIHASFSLKKSA